MQEDELSDEDTRFAIGDKYRDIKSYLETRKKGIIKQHLIKNINRNFKLENYYR
jgi:hypothetical protein